MKAMQAKISPGSRNNGTQPLSPCKNPSAKSARKTGGRFSGMSSAMSPGPKWRAAAPCSQMAAEAPEFAIVRREHDPSTPSPDHLRETESIVFKTGKRIGVEYDGAGRRSGFRIGIERGPHQGLGFFSHAQPWSHDDRVLPTI